LPLTRAAFSGILRALFATANPEAHHDRSASQRLDPFCALQG
jgi:hypothetical protein